MARGRRSSGGGPVAELLPEGWSQQKKNPGREAGVSGIYVVSRRSGGRFLFRLFGALLLDFLHLIEQIVRLLGHRLALRG